MRYFRRVLVVSMLLSLFLHSVAMAAVQDVDTKQMQAIIKGNTGNPNFIILDVSPAGAFASSHLEGAVSLPADDPNFEANLQKFDKDKTYLVYCHRMNWTPKAVAVMSKNNFSNLFASSEGKAGWMQAGGNVVASGMQQVDTGQMKKLIAENKDNQNFVILDVSPAPAYARSHIDGAVSLPVRDPNFEANLQQLDKNKTYLVYCVGGNWTSQAVPMMKQKNFTSIVASTEGLSGWMQTGGKTVSGGGQ